MISNQVLQNTLEGLKEIYREMRSKKTVDYRKIERDEQVQMVAEEPVKYGK